MGSKPYWNTPPEIDRSLGRQESRCTWSHRSRPHSTDKNTDPSNRANSFRPSRQVYVQTPIHISGPSFWTIGLTHSSARDMDTYSETIHHEQHWASTSKHKAKSSIYITLVHTHQGPQIQTAAKLEAGSLAVWSLFKEREKQEQQSQENRTSNSKISLLYCQHLNNTLLLCSVFHPFFCCVPCLRNAAAPWLRTGALRLA